MFSKTLLRVVPTKYKDCTMSKDHAGKDYLYKGYWNPLREMEQPRIFFKIISLKSQQKNQHFSEKRRKGKHIILKRS